LALPVCVLQSCAGRSHVPSVGSGSRSFSWCGCARCRWSRCFHALRGWLVFSRTRSCASFLSFYCSRIVQASAEASCLSGVALVRSYLELRCPVHCARLCYVRALWARVFSAGVPRCPASAAFAVVCRFRGWALWCCLVPSARCSAVVCCPGPLVCSFVSDALVRSGRPLSLSCVVFSVASPLWPISSRSPSARDVGSSPCVASVVGILCPRQCRLCRWFRCVATPLSRAGPVVARGLAPALSVGAFSVVAQWSARALSACACLLVFLSLACRPSPA